MGDASKLERMIDKRMAPVRQAMAESHARLAPDQEWEWDDMTKFLRAAYGKGYTDAYREQSGKLSCLYERSGFKKPK